MRIILLGAGGMIGSRIASELEERGHDVVVASRSSGVDATDPAAVAAASAGADAIVLAVSAREGTYTLMDVAQSLIEGAARAGVQRLIVVGGAGSLEVAPGVRLVDTPEFPDEFRAEALEGAESLEIYRRSDGLEWTYVSPAAYIHPGERTGRYRLGGDQLLVAENGTSEISAEDYAIAIADLLEGGDHSRERVSVAW
jgi:putative NADH-flavin reductase